MNEQVSTSSGRWIVVQPPAFKVRTDLNPALGDRFANSPVEDARSLHALAVAIERSQAKTIKR